MGGKRCKLLTNSLEGECTYHFDGQLYLKYILVDDADAIQGHELATI